MAIDRTRLMNPMWAKFFDRIAQAPRPDPRIARISGFDPRIAKSSIELAGGEGLPPSLAGINRVRGGGAVTPQATTPQATTPQISAPMKSFAPRQPSALDELNELDTNELIARSRENRFRRR
jgi:hypothetical protein